MHAKNAPSPPSLRDLPQVASHRLFLFPAQVGGGEIGKNWNSNLMAEPVHTDLFSLTCSRKKEVALQTIHKLQHKITYSEKYADDIYEYRHVVLPEALGSLVPLHRLMAETEWRTLGVCMSTGWEQYLVHRPEPHILLFRRMAPQP